ncbi:MAG TPA: hypothetical protein VF541_17280 [Longimicrobium sp.]
MPAASSLPAPGPAPPRLRPFGDSAAALAVDLSAPPDPVRITAVLAACADGADPARLEALAVGRRIEWLLALAALELDTFDVALTCPTCREAIEVDLTVAELLEIGRGSGAETATVEAGGVRLTVRRPTAADQAAWCRTTYASEAEAEEAVVRSLLVDDGGVELTPARLACLEEALDQLDPLVALAMPVGCPCCGAASVHPVDVAALALAPLARMQARLIGEVHALARHYHWSEGKVLKLPRWRRARYLALVEREAR